SGKGEDFSGCMILPGLVDMHTHACKGLDFCTATEDEMDTMCNFYADNGVTSVVATGMTLSEEALTEIFTRIGDKAAKGTTGADILGINMEGPYLSAEKKGAHDPQYIALPDVAQLRRLNKASGGRILTVDLTPTAEGALDFIRELHGEVVMSLAHTPADYDTAMEAIKAGASNVTHLFNAMPPFLHRDPGLIGAAFDSDITAELICDGIHIHPAVIRTAFKVLGKRAVLISDSMSAAGMPDGNYTLGGLAVTVKNRKATIASGSIAGSTITVYDGMCNAIRFGVPRELAIHAATAAPAKAIRRQDTVGFIEKGRRADLLIMDKETLAIRKVLLRGVPRG
ncbi:MAG: N-acetylglucosamine-6-phosphate deacetylase, partial [Angelakisella sp.]